MKMVLVGEALLSILLLLSCGSTLSFSSLPSGTVIRRKSCDGYESSRSTIGTIKIKASVEFNADTYDSHFSPPIVETVLSNFRRVDEVVKWRAAAALFISSIFFFRSQLDSHLVNLWTFLQNDSSLLAKIFRHDHWEWALAVGAFGIWIHGFWFADRLVDKVRHFCDECVQRFFNQSLCGIMSIFLN